MWFFGLVIVVFFKLFKLISVIGLVLNMLKLVLGIFINICVMVKVLLLILILLLIESFKFWKSWDCIYVLLDCGNFVVVCFFLNGWLVILIVFFSG